ncbi:unnamed protein product [Closterium sp. NIES-64]|nr:unnamed protein product [Closterium sp. NIES-64]
MLGYTYCTHILRKDWGERLGWFGGGDCLWLAAGGAGDRSVGDAYMIHYTYGCDYDLNGNHLPGKVGPWHFDKRDHQTAIPCNISYPPANSAPSVVRCTRHW